MKALVGLGLMLALAGCIKPDDQSSIKQNFEVVCAGVDVGYIVYKTFEEKVRPSIALKVEASYATAKVVCLNPPADTTQALIVALRAVATFNRELATAKAVADGDSA